jgi:hypothetical protein
MFVAGFCGSYAASERESHLLVIVVFFDDMPIK